MVTTREAAVERVLVAAAAGQAFTFVQSNPTTGKTGERYEVYKKETMFAGLEALKGVNFPGTTRTVFSGGVMTKVATLRTTWPTDLLRSRRRRFPLW